MSLHLIQAAARAHIDDRLRTAERQRLAAHTRAHRSPINAARPGHRSLARRSLRAVFG